ncbi:unnamed protein product, partial [Ectocarpus sp. 12 AP-2014]
VVSSTTCGHTAGFICVLREAPTKGCNGLHSNVQPPHQHEAALGVGMQLGDPPLIPCSIKQGETCALCVLWATGAQGFVHQLYFC